MRFPILLLALFALVAQAVQAQDMPRPVPRHIVVFDGSPGNWTQDHTEDLTYTPEGRILTDTLRGGGNPYLEERRYDDYAHLTAILRHYDTARAGRVDTVVYIRYSYNAATGLIDSSAAYTPQAGATVVRRLRFYYYPGTPLIDSLYDNIVITAGAQAFTQLSRLYPRHDGNGRLGAERAEQYDTRTQTWMLTRDMVELQLAFGVQAYDAYRNFVAVDYEPLARPILFIAGRGLGYPRAGGIDSMFYIGSQPTPLQASSSAQPSRTSNQNALETSYQYNDYGDLTLRQSVQYGGAQPYYNPSDLFQHTYDGSGNLVETVYTNSVPSTPAYKRYLYSDFAQTVAAVKPSQPDRLSLYPNPAREAITIAGAKPGEAFSITDATGRQVLSGTLAQGTRIETTSLRPGLYHLRLAGRSARFAKE